MMMTRPSRPPLFRSKLPESDFMPLSIHHPQQTQMPVGVAEKDGVVGVYQDSLVEAHEKACSQEQGDLNHGTTSPAPLLG